MVWRLFVQFAKSILNVLTVVYSTMALELILEIHESLTEELPSLLNDYV